jgi:hypothetical protein
MYRHSMNYDFINSSSSELPRWYILEIGLVRKILQCTTLGVQMMKILWSRNTYSDKSLNKYYLTQLLPNHVTRSEMKHDNFDLWQNYLSILTYIFYFYLLVVKHN